MLTRITGVLESVEGGTAVVALSLGEGSIAHAALVSPWAAGRLASKIGQPVTLHTIELLESPNQGATFTPRLLGFETREDRAFFEALTRVKGLGPRRALRALAAPTGEVASMIVRGDAKGLTRLPEIGKKLADALIAELAQAVGAFATGEAEGASPGTPGAARLVEPRSAFGAAALQAISALVRLGEPRAEAERLVESAVRNGEGHRPADEILAAALAARGV